MVAYDEEDIEIVMNVTGYDKAKAEKYFKEVANDIEDENTCSLDVLDAIHAEIKAKKNGTASMYVQSSPEKKQKKPREKKVDADKKKIIEILAKALTDNGYNAIISNVDKSIEIGDMTVNLVKHRPPKK